MSREQLLPLLLRPKADGFSSKGFFISDPIAILFYTLESATCGFLRRQVKRLQPSGSSKRKREAEERRKCQKQTEIKRFFQAREASISIRERRIRFTSPPVLATKALQRRGVSGAFS